MILIALLIFAASLSCVLLAVTVWQFLALGDKLDNLISTIWLYLPERSRKWIASHLKIETLNSEARSFFFWIVMASVSVGVYWASGVWLALAIYILLILQVINKRRVAARKSNRAVVRQLPDFCDLIAMMIASGVPLISALEKVSESCSELLLATEIRAMLSRLRRGASFSQSMEELSERYEANELKEWSLMLIKGYQQGASLTKSLRFYANQLRQELLNSAEKRAQEAPVKLLFPLVTCFFPVNFLVILGPVIVQLSQGGFG
ncbi:type II secretion system F family protein [Idiomarina abyssalis]|jgi:tight adherence protein C|uniref:Type II secretion system F family protein n=1 Tax=Idiomarina abyssalis TaxID=86102 RepID=A0A8I1G8K0_9GAMM|nr:type II secretion system F family protein [Idiomarina abyssalis]MBJ7267372.1 type II secretion system F family protein [Idiomarina abyssalis]MBJ7273365.1 type II secretion system F family protein [Idiomarina abyssalis]MBJ7315119.1 type II secretion system F family protein [Idiomarina abyssalis]